MLLRLMRKSIQKEEYAEYIRRWAPEAGDGS